MKAEQQQETPHLEINLEKMKVSCSKAPGDLHITTPARPTLQKIEKSVSPPPKNPLKSLGQTLAGAAAALTLSAGVLSGSAIAGEFDILTEATPTTRYVIDDASVLSKTTKGALNSKLKALEDETGYRLEVVTVRKLEFETDPFVFGDKVIEKWYTTAEKGGKKGILLIVTTAKDGALTGGPEFLKAVGDPLIDSVISNDIPILSEEQKFNEAVVEMSSRIDKVIRGEEDPGGPVRENKKQGRTYKTKEETAKTKNITSTLVATLLFISVVVPMLQYYGYTSKE